MRLNAEGLHVQACNAWQFTERVQVVPVYNALEGRHTKLNRMQSRHI
jgi:hypothetical protein